MIYRSVFRQCFPLLVVTGFGLMLAGLIFGGLDESLEKAPGLIVMIPPMIGLRGNIGSALASRLGTATHMGFVSSRNIWNERTKSEIASAIILSIVLSFFVGAFAYLTCVILGLQHMFLWKFLFISTATGLIDGTLLSFLTLSIIFLADRRGADPDNVASPALTTAGDLSTMLILFAIVVGTGVIT